MKVTTIALAAALTLTSTVALAQTKGTQIPGTEGYGSVVQPSVGSYPTTVGSTNTPSTWQNTGPSATAPGNSAQVPAAPTPSAAPTTGMHK
jgi:hypothetical protein